MRRWSSAGESPDHEWASAVDNYHVAWRAEIVDQNGEARPGGWNRVIGEGADGIDSARADGPSLGGYDSARLVTRVIGPATVSWWWRADPLIGDFLVFTAGDDVRIEWQKKDTAGRKDGWVQHSVDIGPGDQEIAWVYEKDGFDPDGAVATDVAFVDQIWISSAGQETVQPTKRKDPERQAWTLVEWQSVEGRVYKLEYSQDEGPWTEVEKRPRRADGEAMVVIERTAHAARREYRVHMLQPPSLTLVPESRQLVPQGKELQLRYGAEGSGEIAWRWTHEHPRVETIVELEETGPELHIRNTSLRNAGTYRVVASNEAGKETAGPIEVIVGLLPRVKQIDWKQGRDPIAPLPVKSDEPQVLEVDLETDFSIKGVVEGTQPIKDAKWQQYDAGISDWRDLPDAGCRKEEGRCESGLVELSGETGEEAVIYRLWARNDFGVGTGPELTLSPWTAPDVPYLVEGQDISVYEGDVTSLAFEFEPGGNEGFAVRWLKQQKPVPDGEGTRIRLAPEADAWCDPKAQDTPLAVHYVAQLWRSEGGTRPEGQSHAVKVKVITPTERVLNLGKDPDSGKEVRMDLVPIPGGRFSMGRNKSAEGNEGPQRLAEISHTYWIGKTEVSGAQWKAVMGTTRAKPEEFPAGVSHDEAVRFVEKLTERHRKSNELEEKYAYALPTEAQWERAAQLAWPEYQEIPKTQPEPGEEAPILKLHPVTERPAPCGLHGMFENSWEWTRNWYAEDADESKTVDPTGPRFGVRRTLRGGGTGLRPHAVSPTVRIGIDPSQRKARYGFRLVLERPEEPRTYRLGKTEPDSDKDRPGGVQ